MNMKLDNIKYLIDEVYDPLNKLEKLESKPKPKLALELTPTVQHNPCHDLFRIYTFKLLKKLADSFEVILLYRDIQATTEVSLEEAKKLAQESISVFRSAKVPFTVYYESEILQKHLVNMPESFFLQLYQNILHKDHNHFSMPLMYSSVSQAVILPLLKILNVDVLLSMHHEKENFDILAKMKEIGPKNLPIMFYRQFPDLSNKKHSGFDKIRLFPRVDWSEDKIYKNLIKNKTSFKTIEEWYVKLDIINEKVFEVNKEKLSFKQLINKRSKNEILRKVSKHLYEFLQSEGKFLELASKEFKISLGDLDSNKILECLNTSTRIEIIKLLNKQSLAANEISKEIKISLPTILFHLQKLKEANIVNRDLTKIYHLNVNRFLLSV